MISAYSTPPAMMVGIRTARRGATNTCHGPDPTTLRRSVRAVREHTRVLSDGETWKPIPRYEGYYDVSDMGRVRSADRRVWCVNHYQTHRGRILSPAVDESGRLAIRLYRDNKGKTVRVHRLVMLAFIGPCPEDMEVCHNNGDPADNRLSNLRYDTRSENTYDMVGHGTHNHARTTHCPRGHAYVADNITRSASSVGNRACLACKRAGTHVTHNPWKEPFMQEVSDIYYERIIEGNAGKRIRWSDYDHRMPWVAPEHAVDSDSVLNTDAREIHSIEGGSGE